MTDSMATFRNEFKQLLLSWLEIQVPGYSELVFYGLVVLWIVLFTVVLHFLLQIFLRGMLVRVSKRPGQRWLRQLLAHNLFRRISYLFQGIVLHVQVSGWLEESPSLLRLIEAMAELWILLFGLLAFFSLLDAFQSVMYQRAGLMNFPLRGLVQTIKLIASVFTALLAASTLMGESPIILLSGLGALSAVLLLVFKDPLLGLVAGIQLSANRMLSVGDWLEMPKYGADGDVLDIALTTVKVRNWDKTITTIPTYALISDSFKNWRGMSETGGRRIKRSVLIETSSIRFMDDEMLQRLKHVHLLTDYLQEKMRDIAYASGENRQDLTVGLNRRRLTNIGTFRAYLLAYLQAHSNIRQDLTVMVRQLEPTSEGLPVEIYAFTRTIKWSEYEEIQSNIFDHVLSILPEFGLRAHEAPTGHDVRSLADRYGEA